MIRPATAEDFEGFWRCLDAVARERRFLALVEAPPPDKARSHIEEARARGLIELVVVQDQQIVGWCDVTPKGFEGFRHSATLGMGLLPACRGRGIGAKLVERALQAARERGLTRLELEVFDSNAAAIRLYRRAGFVVEGVKRAARVINGHTEDILFMAMLL